MLSHDKECLDAPRGDLLKLSGSLHQYRETWRHGWQSRILNAVEIKPYLCHRFSNPHYDTPCQDARVRRLNGSALRQSIETGLRHAVKSNQYFGQAQRGGDRADRRPQPHLIYERCRIWVTQKRLSAIKRFEWRELAATTSEELVLEETAPVDRKRMRWRQVVHQWDPIAAVAAETLCEQSRRCDEYVGYRAGLVIAKIGASLTERDSPDDIQK